MSPNFPGKYPNNKKCNWTIVVPTGERIILKFDSFKLEQSSRCIYDWFQALDGVDFKSKTLGSKLCGANKPSEIKPSSNILHLIFEADARITSTGFKISYTYKGKLF
jgi:hypothetical protein